MADNVIDVIVSTPLGEMEGKAVMDVEGTKLSGVMTIMGKDNVISGGTIDDNGHFSFEGKMKMPIGKLGYTVTGRLTDGRIEAVCQTMIGEVKIRSK